MKSLSQWLKEESSAEHQKVEAKLDVFNRVRSLSDHKQLLQSFYGLHLTYEKNIAIYREQIKSVLDWDISFKSSLLEKDLSYLGLTTNEIENLPRCSEDSLALYSLPNTVGTLYVMEGSAMGGQFIGKKLSELFNIQTHEGLLFYFAHSQNLREYWRQFTKKLDDYGEKNLDKWPEILSASKRTFRCFENWCT